MHRPVYLRTAMPAAWAFVAGLTLILCATAVADTGYYAPVGQLDTPGYAAGLAVSGDYVYVADGSSLRIIDVSDPTEPVEVGSLTGLIAATDVAVAGHYAYVADGLANLRIVDISDPTNPTQVGQYVPPVGGPYTVTRLALKGTYAFLGTVEFGMRVINCANPAAPTEVCFKFGLETPGDLVVSGDYLYCADADGYLWDYEVLDPADTQALTPWSDGSGHTYGAAVADGNIYWSPGHGLQWWIGPDPEHITYGGHVSGACGRLAATGGYVYIARTYALFGSGCLQVIKPADTAAPIFGVWYTGGRSEDVAVANGYVYLADGSGGLVIFRQAALSTISGKVSVGATATGLAGATVAAYVGNTLKGSTTTDANGLYAIPDLRPESYTVSVTKSGYATQTQTVVVGVGVTVTANFGVSAVGLTGQVRVSGASENIADATVTAYLDGALKGTATTNAKGIYAIAATLPTGSYVVTAAKDGYVQQTKAGIAVTSGTVNYCNFALALSGALRGQVRVSGTTTNLAGAKVEAYLGGVLKASAVTDANGIYAILGNLPAGSYVIVVTQTGYVTRTKSGIAVIAGGTSYCNFALDPVCLKGQVRISGTTTNLQGATVTVYSGDTAIASATTNATGIYEIGGVTAGTYTVIAAKAGYVRHMRLNIVISEGLITYTNFSPAVSGRLRGQVKNRITNSPIAGVTVTARMGGVVRAVGTTTSPYGVYDIASDLPAGSYTVIASKDGYTTQTKANIVVTAGATSYVNFGLELQ